MIRIKGLSVAAGAFRLENFCLDIGDGEYFILLGPTGAGKTVLVESIAGLRRIESGEIWLDKTEISTLRPEERNISIVYQDQALFRHLSVRENIVFGLKVRRQNRREISQALGWISGLIKIEHLLGRSPGTLSGGERQKVALARALIVKPQLLILDEPLSALDPETREMTQHEIREIHKSMGTTVVHVTHDFEEAVTLGQRIAVINKGKVEQAGPPDEIFRKPASEFVARFTMGRNIFEGMSFLDHDGRPVFRTETIEFAIEKTGPDASHALIRPEDAEITLERGLTCKRNCLAGTITDIAEKGAVAYVSVDLPPEVCCMVTRQSLKRMDLSEGKRVYVSFDPSSVHLFG